MAHEDEDVITLLQGQHQEIRRLFTELETAEGDRRQQLFRDLVRLLAVHETAEEEVVHPTRGWVRNTGRRSC
jgi:hemerythrin superfamily protein